MSQPTTRVFANLEIPDFEVEDGDEEGAAAVAAAAEAAVVEEEVDGVNEDQEEIQEGVIWWTRLSRTTLNTRGHLRRGSNVNTNPREMLQLNTGFDPHTRTNGNENYQRFFRNEFIPAALWIHNENDTFTATIEATLVTPEHQNVETILEFHYNPLYATDGRKTVRNIHMRLSPELKTAFGRGVTQQEYGENDDGNQVIENDGNPEIPVGHYIQLERRGTGEDAEYTVSIVPPPPPE